MLRFSLLILSGAMGAAHSQESVPLRIFSSNGVRIVLEEMQPRIEAAIERPLAFEFSTARTLVERLRAGEQFDVAVLTPELIDVLVAEGLADPDARADFARVGIGVGVRKGMPARSVASLDDLRSTLLAARSVAFGANGQSRETNEASFEVLGITQQMAPRIRLTGPGEAPKLVAGGEVDVVLTLVSELLREPGVEFLGPLPPEVQGYILFTAARARNSSWPEDAQAFLDMLSTPELAAALLRHGLEPTAR